MAERVVILGGTGTVGRAFCQHLATCGVEHVVWNRSDYPLTDIERLRHRLQLLAPTYVYNFAVADAAVFPFINSELPGVLHTWTAEIGFKLIHTSSVMVFTDAVSGPFYPDTPPNAEKGYGLSKLQAEQRINKSSGNTVVVRLGWQIADETRSNNMIAFLERAAVANGAINASRRWYPSCSFVEVTARELWRLRNVTPALYQINQNTNLSFYEIVLGLRARYNKMHWSVVADDSYTHNQLMLDSRLELPPLFVATE